MGELWRPPPGSTAHGPNACPLAPTLDADIAFLPRYGVDAVALAEAQTRARLFAMPAADMAIRTGLVSETIYSRCLAHDLGLTFTETPPPAPEPFFQHWPANRIAGGARYIRGLGIESGHWQGHVAPDAEMIDVLRTGLTNGGGEQLRQELAIAPRSANRAVLEKQCEPSLVQEAEKGLEDRHPEASARRVIEPRQAVILLIVIQILFVLIWFAPNALVLGLHLAASVFYLSCVALRLVAAASFRKMERMVVPANERRIDRSQDHLLPVYSVLVPLYGEAGEVPGLLQALLKLDWPRERLEIKLVCEGDDPQTIYAVRTCLASVPPGLADLVTVPPHHPRTKPKALNFAMPLCSGDFIVVYDAEDRPDPLQLREAFARFYTSDFELGCLQAPLTIHNAKQGFLPLMFAAEYAGLFEGILPFLARHKAPIPLGGTSNHFRRIVLETVGGWDAFNVTEDADLGVRLARHGYRIGVLRHPTYEEAPVRFDIWLKQRTRWFKGWYQTWLVHTRQPVRLMRELGLKGTIVFHIMITGMIVSALIHPFLLYFVLIKMSAAFAMGWTFLVFDPLFFFDLVTVSLGYLAMARLAWVTLPVRRLGVVRTGLWGLPIHWLAISVAAWRALWQLFTDPHQWEKTRHTLSSPIPAAVNAPVQAPVRAPMPKNSMDEPTAG